MSLPGTDAAAGAQRLQRPKGSGKLRFGKDRIFRTLSGSEASQPRCSASSNSLASSDGEELTTWRIESHASTAPARRRSSDNEPAVSAPSTSAAARPGTVQPPETWACSSLAELEVQATIGALSGSCV